MAQAYCVKDKMKVEVQNPQNITMKNGKPAHPGHLPEVRQQGLPDRRWLTTRVPEERPTPASNGGGRRFPAPVAAGRWRAPAPAAAPTALLRSAGVRTDPDPRPRPRCQPDPGRRRPARRLAGRPRRRPDPGRRRTGRRHGRRDRAPAAGPRRRPAGAPAASIAAIGISAIGPLDLARGRLRRPPNLPPTFADVPFAEPIGAALGLPWAIDRDTHVAVAGRARVRCGSRRAGRPLPHGFDRDRRGDRGRRPAGGRSGRGGRRARPPHPRHRRAAVRVRRARPPRGDLLGQRHRPGRRGGDRRRPGARPSGRSATASRPRPSQPATSPRPSSPATPTRPRSWPAPGSASPRRCVSLVDMFAPELIVVGGSSPAARASAGSSPPGRPFATSRSRSRRRGCGSSRRPWATTSGSSGRSRSWQDAWTADHEPPGPARARRMARGRIGRPRRTMAPTARTDRRGQCARAPAAAPPHLHVHSLASPPERAAAGPGGTHDDRSRRDQRLRPDRPPVAQGAHRARPGRRGRRGQRPGRHRAQRAPVQARLDVRRLSRHGRAHRRTR